jgi:parvulin-like peptidyl-prolyl isomerase
MRYRFLVAIGLLAVSVHTQASSVGVDQALPVKAGRPAVATVGGDVISLDELVRELDPPVDRARLLTGRGTAKELALLDRLINIKLIWQEGARMGLDELPEIRKQVEVTSREILREVAFESVVKNVRPDAAAVEKRFREQVREWKTASMLFKDEAAARRAQKELASGATFADVSKRAAAAKTARVDQDNAYHPRREYLPQIADALAALQPGQASPVIRLPAGFVILRVLDIRYPENPEARAEARKDVLAERQQAVLKAREEALRRDYVVVNKTVLASVDYEAAKPGVDALLKDQRVVARIRGAESVTVGDLTDYLRLQYFHGTDQASQRKKMNSQKEAALDATLGRRLWNMEALRLGIDKSNEYRDRVAGYQQSLVFDSFLQKVIAPANRVTEDEVRKYYNAHLKDYSYPAMLRIRGLAFTRRNAAEDAARKLREGTDYGWLAANADGQAAKGTPGLIVFDGRPVTTDSMTDGVRKALEGARAGETRVYASPEGHFYVFSVQQVIPATARPFSDVRDEAAQKAYAEKIQKGVEDYAGRLRAKLKVESYLKRMP